MFLFIYYLITFVQKFICYSSVANIYYYISIFCTLFVNVSLSFLFVQKIKENSMFEKVCKCKNTHIRSHIKLNIIYMKTRRYGNFALCQTEVVNIFPYIWAVLISSYTIKLMLNEAGIIVASFLSFTRIGWSCGNLYVCSYFRMYVLIFERK